MKGSVQARGVFRHLASLQSRHEPLNLPYRKVTRKPKKDPIKTTVPLKGGYMGFHVILGKCNGQGLAKLLSFATAAAEQKSV